jgi:DNA-binding NarL/FixJ family response regulator
MASRLRAVVIDDAFLPDESERIRSGQPALTKREREVLRELCCGLRNRDISTTLYIAESTVEYHVKRLMTKLGARSRADVVRRAIHLGLDDASAADAC